MERASGENPAGFGRCAVGLCGGYQRGPPGCASMERRGGQEGWQLHVGAGLWRLGFAKHPSGAARRLAGIRWGLVLGYSRRFAHRPGAMPLAQVLLVENAGVLSYPLRWTLAVMGFWCWSGQGESNPCAKAWKAPDQPEAWPLNWHPGKESNPQPAVLETAALPVELPGCGCLTGTRTRLTKGAFVYVHPKGPVMLPDCRVHQWNQAETKKPALGGLWEIWRWLRHQLAGRSCCAGNTPALYGAHIVGVSSAACKISANFYPSPGSPLLFCGTQCGGTRFA